MFMWQTVYIVGTRVAIIIIQNHIIKHKKKKKKSHLSIFNEKKNHFKLKKKNLKNLIERKKMYACGALKKI